jgi:hypothetical protein
MARATLTVQTVAQAGITPSLTAADVGNGNQFVWPGKSCWIEAKNAGSIADLTIATPATVSGLAVADLVVSIPATTGDKLIYLADASLFVQSDGYVYVNAAAAMTIGVFTSP